MMLTKVMASRTLLQNVKNQFVKPTNLTSSIGFSTSTRNGIRAARRQAQTTKGSNFGAAAIGTGQALVAGSSAVGLGALCYYGFGMSKGSVSTLDAAVMWPQYIRQRVKDTYMYFGGSLAVTAGSAYLISQSPTLMSLVSRTGLMSIVLTVGAMIGTSMLCRSIEYKPGFGPKQLSWMLHAAVVGAVIAPLTVLGGPLLIRAATYTAGVAGGISAVAMCAPSEQFLNWGGPLAAGFGVVFLASLGNAFLPPTGAAGMTLYSISMYGGLVLFSLLLLYNTQKTIKKAESHPAPPPPNSYIFQQRHIKPYDPINSSMAMYMDVVNIFMRIAIMMANGNRRR